MDVRKGEQGRDEGLELAKATEIMKELLMSMAVTAPDVKPIRFWKRADGIADSVGKFIWNKNILL